MDWIKGIAIGVIATIVGGLALHSYTQRTDLKATISIEAPLFRVGPSAEWKKELPQQILDEWIVAMFAQVLMDDLERKQWATKNARQESSQVIENALKTLSEMQVKIPVSLTIYNNGPTTTILWDKFSIELNGLVEKFDLEKQAMNLTILEGKNETIKTEFIFSFSKCFPQYFLDTFISLMSKKFFKTEDLPDPLMKLYVHKLKNTNPSTQVGFPMKIYCILGDQHGRQHSGEAISQTFGQEKELNLSKGTKKS